jgi:hypothetical protein
VLFFNKIFGAEKEAILLFFNGFNQLTDLTKELSDKAAEIDPK